VESLKQEAPALEIIDLLRCYGDFRAVDGISIAVKPGEVVGLLGPNGAGKTTTVRTALGFLKPDGGSVRLLGLDPVSASAASREEVGYLPGELHLDPGPSGARTLDFFAGFRAPIDPQWRAELVERLQLDIRKPVGDYSKGNRQKLGIIAAFQHRPRLAILDEPTSGLDPLMQHAFHELVAELSAAGTAVLLSSHVLSEVEQICDRVIVMRRGKIVLERDVGELTEDRIRRLELFFEGEPPASLALPGLIKLERHGDRVQALLQAAPKELIAALAVLPLRDFLIGRPALDDLFLDLYREGDE